MAATSRHDEWLIDLHPRPRRQGETAGGHRRERIVAKKTNESDTPVLDLLASMNAESLETSTLDTDKLMLVRLAALVAVDAAPMSFFLNLGAAAEVGIDVEQIRGVLAAIAPIVGSARVTSATGNILRALGTAIDLSDLEEETKRAG
jgi:4-carboxymuconolactone decarboxylase